jgi:hypothetical protein
MNTSTYHTTTAMIIGNGKGSHIPYTVEGRLTGSACNPYAWQTSHIRYTDRPVNCTRCAKAVHRAAQTS